MGERCSHCGYELTPHETAFLAADHERVLCRLCTRLDGAFSVRRESEYWGITSRMLDEHQAALEMRLKRCPNYIEIVSSIYETLLLARPDQYEALQRTLALEVYVAGRDPYAAKFKMHQAQLLKQNRDDWVKILSGECAACRRLPAAPMRAGEALDHGLLPCRECTFGVNEREPYPWCRCMYVRTRKPH